MKRVNLAASLIILLIVGIAQGWLIPNYVPSAHDAGDLPPTLVPMLSMAVCALTALLLGISAWRRSGHVPDETQDDEAADQLIFGLKEAANLLLCLAAGRFRPLLDYNPTTFGKLHVRHVLQHRFNAPTLGVTQNIRVAQLDDEIASGLGEKH